MTCRRTLSLAALAALTLAQCARNPVSGQRELALVSEKQEIELGREAAREVAASLGLVEDKELQAYVTALGERLVEGSERPNLPWQFRVVDDPTPNAFALPGGFIYITRGLLAGLNSEAELAMVLGHEIGHVTARHSVQQITKQQVAQLGLGVGMVLVPELQQVGQLAGAGLQLLFLKFGRDDERQADNLGFRYALDDDYDVRSGALVFRTLARVGEASGGGRVPGWLQTHPNPKDRLQSLVAKADKTRVDWRAMRRNRGQLLSRVDGLVYGDDPRQGYFVGSTFVHPELRFEVDFPGGWRTQNQPQAVVAMSPEQDAAIIVGIVPGASPAQAAQKFAAQQGLRAAAYPGRCLEGADCLAFAAESQQGPVQGYTTFLEHGGKTYQVAAFAPRQRFEAHDPALRTAMVAFAPVRDARRLAVRAATIDVVSVPEPMSLREFAERYPSSVPLDELALINGLEAKARLERGQLVKRVVGGEARRGGEIGARSVERG